MMAHMVSDCIALQTYSELSPVLGSVHHPYDLRYSYEFRHIKSRTNHKEPPNVYGLFKDTVNNSDYTASNAEMTGKCYLGKNFERNGMA
jgi:hypothetical protein